MGFGVGMDSLFGTAASSSSSSSSSKDGKTTAEADPGGEKQASGLNLNVSPIRESLKQGTEKVAQAGEKIKENIAFGKAAEKPLAPGERNPDMLVQAA